MELEHGLGRLYAPDERDQMYPMKSVLPKKASTRTYRYWYQHPVRLDQGTTPQCVGYSCTHYLLDGPVTNHLLTPKAFAEKVYREAQKLDPWAHIPHDGTTVRAAAKYLQSVGYISEYRWAWNLDTLIQAVLEVGPVVVGTTWYMDMFYPDAKGFVKATGADAGGHAWLVTGVNVKEKKIRGCNSWGLGWGIKGNFWMTFEEFGKLMDRYVEMCLAVEVKK